MRRNFFWMIPLVLIIGALGMGLFSAQAGGHGKEREVTINEVPQPVMEIILKEAGRNRIEEIEEVDLCDWKIYEAEWLEKGKEVEIQIALACKLIGRSVENAEEEEEEEGDGEDDEIEEEEREENEKEVSLSHVPAPVKEIIIKEAGNNKIEEIEVMDLGGWWIYEAEWTTRGKEVEISIALTCKLIGRSVENAEEEGEDEDDEDGDNDEEREDAEDNEDEDEVEVTLDQLPTPVRETILEMAGNNRITEIEKSGRGKRTIYEAEWIARGKKIEIQVSAKGKLLGKKIEVPDEDEEEDDD